MKNILNLSKRRSKDFIWRSIQFLSRQGFTFFVLLVAAKLLTKEEFGAYNYIIAIGFLFTLIADFGISRAVTKFTAQYNTVEKERLKSIFFNAGLIIVGITLLLIIIALSFSNQIADEYGTYLKFLIPFFLFMPLSSLFDGIYTGLKKFKKLGVLNLIAAVIALPISFFLIKEERIYGAFYSLDIFYTLLFTMLALFHKNYSFRFHKEILIEVGKYSFIIGMASLGQFLYSKANTIILGKYHFISEVGYYELIDKTFVLLAIPFIIVSQIMAPKLTELSTLNKDKEVFSYFKKSLNASFLLGLLITLAVYFLFPIAIERFFPKYNTPHFFEIFYLIIFNLPFLIVSNTLAQPFIVATGNAKYSLLTIPFGILNVTLALIFISLFGFIGVVYSLLFSSITNKLVTYFLLFKKLKV